MARSRRGITGVVGRFIFAVLAVATARNSAAQTQPTSAKYSPPSQAAQLQTTFIDWDALPVREMPQGISRAVFDNPAPGLEKLELHITTLKPGMTLHAPHHHAWEEMCLVKEGQVQVTINGRKHRAGPGDLAFFASHDAHSIENVSDKPVTYFVMNLCAPRAQTTPDKPAAEQAAPGKLQSSVFDCNNVPATPTATGSIATIFDSPTLTFTRLASQIITLSAGQSMRGERSSAESELWFLKSGRLELIINGIACRAAEGSFFYCSPSDQPTLKNIGTAPAVCQVIRFAPAPASADEGRGSR